MRRTTVYIGSRRASPILLRGLVNLEYRGYDSAGMAILDLSVVYKNNSDLYPVHTSSSIPLLRNAVH
ncbi:hypothetical protein [Geoglobus acetivorans]|uniref:Glutamine amidotransferase type-2 domain-containing protein n=1 Tax=Geoglobus acetivorans TaxID=565033 RepID=A0ABZ3H475_GEOAI|nr:hypothetical protein [Geoglobus acetivorans]